jgi:sodium transport system ATP-binding protein
MIKVTNFTKIYKLSRKQMNLHKTKDKIKKAVDNVSFEARAGEIFGLLGPNGAGKTTTLRSIVTLLKPTEGNITVAGFDVVKEPFEVRKRIGFLTNELKLDGHFTPDYTFTFFGKLHGLEVDKIEERKAMLFEYFGISSYKDKKISELSTGMTQKLSIAISLVHDPEVVIFDEPTNGLDIITAKAVTDYLTVLKNEGKLVIVSTHIMSVAEKLCDHIAIIIGGKKVAAGTIADVLEMTGTETLEDAFFNIYKQEVKEEA